MSIQRKIVNQIRWQADIADVVQYYLGKNWLRRNGSASKLELVGLCPFHEETTPSFFVVGKKQFCCCKVCGFHGNIFEFVERYEGVGFLAAVAKVAEITRQKLPPGKSNLTRARRRSRVVKKKPVRQHVRQHEGCSSCDIPF